MAKIKRNKYDDEVGGVWRTIGGRHIFIKTGQSLSDAMKESGKFKKASDVSRNEYHTLKDEFALEDKIKEKTKNDPKYKNLDYDKETYELDRRLEARYNSTEAKDLSGLEGKHINKEQQLSDIENKKRRLQDGKEIHEVYRQMSDKEMKAFAEKNPEAIEKMKEYTKDKHDYDLYVKAKTNPDSIDPMTENSTDWESLEKKYGERYKKEKGELDKKNAEVMLRGAQRSLEFEKDGLERAKRDGQSVENISDRTRRVHELELEVQKTEEYYNRINASEKSINALNEIDDIVGDDKRLQKLGREVGLTDLKAYKSSYEKYMKEHPQSKMSLADFIELKKN